MQTYRTDEFGVTTQTAGTLTQPIQYAGEVRDPAGLTDLRARAYYPLLGRFLQRDPFAGSLTRPQSLNRYTYVENNPINATDPSGFKARALVDGPEGGPTEAAGVAIGSAIRVCLPGFGLFAPICWSPSETGGRDTTQTHACPGPGSTWFNQNINGFDVLGRGPEGGPDACHVNVEAKPGLNWHVRWAGSHFWGWDLGRGNWELPTAEAREAARLIVTDVIAYIAPHGPDAADVWAMYPDLSAALSELKRYRPVLTYP